MTTRAVTENGILINTQLGIFFKDPITQPEKTIWQPIEAQGKFPTPTIIPVPNEDQLGDIPIVQALSQGLGSDNQIRLSIARKRMDIFLDGKGEQAYPDIETIFLKNVDDIVSTLDGRIKITRVGFIVRSFIEVVNPNEKMLALLSKNLVKLQKKSAPIETSVRYITRESMSNPELEINNYTEYLHFKANITNTDSPSREGVLIVRDINTAPGEDYSDKLESGSIKSFIKAAKPLLNFPDYKIW